MALCYLAPNRLPFSTLGILKNVKGCLESFYVLLGWHLGLFHEYKGRLKPWLS